MKVSQKSVFNFGIVRQLAEKLRNDISSTGKNYVKNFEHDRLRRLRCVRRQKWKFAREWRL